MFLYYILHTITGCQPKDVTHYKNMGMFCEKCGRLKFTFRKY